MSDTTRGNRGGRAPAAAARAAMLAAAALLVAAGSAHADGIGTATFTDPGQHSFTVPAGVTRVTVTAVGGRGGSGCFGWDGGRGAALTATLPVSPGEVLAVGVGAAGADCTLAQVTGGGGGGYSDDSRFAGGGGGASAVTAPVVPGFTSVLLVAGGGGGSGALEDAGTGAGGDAGSSGGDGPSGAHGGQAGSATAGGAGGASDAPNNGPGFAGTAGQGGNGGGDSFTPNGGGGGYFGGGGGGGGYFDGSGGGGGGSSYASPIDSNVQGPTPTFTQSEVSIAYAAPTADLAGPGLSGGAYAFPGTQPLATAGKAEVFTLTNNGSAPLQVSGVVVGGANPDDYLVDNRCQDPVAASGSNACQIGVRFAPQAQGPRTATLTIDSNSVNGPDTVALSGTGGPLPQGPKGDPGTNGRDAQPSIGSGAGDPTPLTPLVLGARTLTVDRHGNVHDTITCQTASIGDCVGVDELTTTDDSLLRRLLGPARAGRTRVVTLGEATFRVAPGTSRTVTIRLSATTLKLLAKHHIVKARHIIVAHDSRGVAQTSSGPVRLKAAAPRR